MPIQRVNEVPYRPHLRLRQDTDVLDRLGLKLSAQGTRQACLSLVANLMYAALRERAAWVFYSRDRNHYAAHAQMRRYRPAFYSWHNIMQAVDVLERAGLIDHRKTVPSPQAIYRSRIRAKPELIARLDLLRVTDFAHGWQEVVILRDVQGKHAPYSDSRDVRRMRSDVVAHNNHLSGFRISVRHPDAVYDEHGFLRVGLVCLDPERHIYHRVFNQSFARGGRWYGPFWQSLPTDFRSAVEIDSTPTIELDFRACHLRLLTSVAGLNLPFGDPHYDPYDVPGFVRSDVKLAFNVMLNAASTHSARYALANELVGGSWSARNARACALMAAVQQQFPPLAGFWNAGVGIRLQNLDARICTSIQRRMRKAGIPVLSVHDSFIVPQTHEASLHAVMTEEMDRMCARLAKKGRL